MGGRAVYLGQVFLNASCQCPVGPVLPFVSGYDIDLISSCGFKVSDGRKFDTTLFCQATNPSPSPAIAVFSVTLTLPPQADTALTATAFVLINGKTYWASNVGVFASRDSQGWVSAGVRPEAFDPVCVPVACSGKLCFGSAQQGSQKKLELFDENSGTWSSKAFDLIQPLSLTLHGKAYFLSGVTNAAGFEVFDPKTNSVSKLPTNPALAPLQPIFFTDGNFIFAGCGHNNAYYGDTTRIVNLWRYDDATSEWKEMATPPFWGLNIVESISGTGTCYVLTGHLDSLYQETYQWWAYNPMSDAWSKNPAIAASQLEPPSASYAVTGKSLYYVALGKIKEYSLADGSSRIVCNVPMDAGPSPILVASANWIYLCPSNLDASSFWKHPVQ